jgi:hypothetical protein
MQHVRKSIEDLRRYIAVSDSREELEEVDALLGVALEELRRALRARQTRNAPGASRTVNKS